MRECIVRFKLFRGNEVKDLRGLIFIESGQEPTEAELIDCFDGMGFHVKLEDARRKIFKSVQPSDDITIEITSFDYGQEKNEAPDRTVRAIASQFIKKERPLS